MGCEFASNRQSGPEQSAAVLQPSVAIEVGVREDAQRVVSLRRGVGLTHYRSHRSGCLRPKEFSQPLAVFSSPH